MAIFFKKKADGHLDLPDTGFWNLVGSILPDWESRRAWLNRNEHFLNLRRVEPE